MTTYFWPTKLTEEEKRQRHNDCQRKWYYRNIEKRKEYNKKYYETHKTERSLYMKEYSKKWREDHKEYMKKYRKEYAKKWRENIKKIKEENKELKAEIERRKETVKELNDCNKLRIAENNKLKEQLYKDTAVQEIDKDGFVSDIHFI